MAARTLAGLLEAGHEVVLVVSAPDRRRGRRAEASPSAVKALALERGLPVSERVADVVGSGAELGVVVAFGRLVRPEVLAAVPMVNVHFSLLPRWRGAAPVERAILAGDPVTGVCLMALEEGLDTGPLYSCVETPVRSGETAAELRQRLGELGLGALLELLARWPEVGEPTPQQGEATYAAKLHPAELELDFSAGATSCERTVRVGRAWTTFRRRRLIVHRALVVPFPGGGDGLPPPGTLVGDLVVTGDSSPPARLALRLLEVQGEGRAPQAFGAWAIGARPAPGERLGESR